MKQIKGFLKKFIYLNLAVSLFAAPSAFAQQIEDPRNHEENQESENYEQVDADKGFTNGSGTSESGNYNLRSTIGVLSGQIGDTPDDPNGIDGSIVRSGLLTYDDTPPVAGSVNFRPEEDNIDIPAQIVKDMDELHGNWIGWHDKESNIDKFEYQIVAGDAVTNPNEIYVDPSMTIVPLKQVDGSATSFTETGLNLTRKEGVKLRVRALNTTGIYSPFVETTATTYYYLQVTVSPKNLAFEPDDSGWIEYHIHNTKVETNVDNGYELKIFKDRVLTHTDGITVIPDTADGTLASPQAYTNTDTGLALNMQAVGGAPLESKWQPDVYARLPSPVSPEESKVANVVQGDFFPLGVEHDYTMKYALRAEPNQKDGIYTTQITYLAEAETLLDAEERM